MRHLFRENLFRGANNFGAFCCHSRNTGALHNARDLQLYVPWLSVLLKDTSAANG